MPLFAPSDTTLTIISSSCLSSILAHNDQQALRGKHFQDHCSHKEWWQFIVAFEHFRHVLLLLWMFTKASRLLVHRWSVSWTGSPQVDD
jgi:hypothetical protein